MTSADVVDTTARASKAWVLGPLLSALLALPFLRAAAKLDKHFTTHDGVDHRTHAGLFVLYGIYATVPCLVSCLFSKRYRRSSVVVGVVVLVLAGVCETVVTVAPEPWFT